MFTLLALLICYALLTFGAVLPNSWFLLVMLWLVGISGWLAFQAFRGRGWRLVFLVMLLLLAVMFWFRQPLWSTGLLAGVWAWWAAVSNEKRVVRFLNVLLIIGILEALLGLAQFFVVPGWIFGYINPVSRSSGTLINRNHFAGLMEMLVPVALGLAYMSARRFGEVARAYLYILAAAFMSLALLFSLSRMGIVSLLCTLCF